ncbi:MAG: MYG1 family protein [Opitutales bacterium]|nr:MYG1 family protein [Opitutales bacterium]
MTEFHTILTHPGSAHKDEFVACCLLLTEANAPILRRDPTPTELEDPGVCVVDIGHRYEEKLNLFDHHQFSVQQAPACSVTLVLGKLGLHQDAQEFCDWLEPMEWFDSRGLIETARWLGTEPKLLRRLNSPIEGALLRAFSACEQIHPGHFLWQTMKLIGQDIRGFLENLRARLQQIDQEGKILSCGFPGQEFEVFFLPRSEPLPEDPAMGMGRYIERKGWKDRIVGMIYPDRRGEGYGLSRFNDDQRLNFLAIQSCEDVHFAHANGFLAKTTATAESRLCELMSLAWRGP